ncbi:MAG: glycosyltransferase family 39 protein [Anaerolineales bacterium]|nr:glycosyltransferase family 39 protein [Anaerolineales bacterium]
MKISFPVRIYLIALILRLIPILATRGLGIGLDDMFQYDMLARSLASGNGFRWYAQDDLKLLEPYVDFDLSSAQDYDPQYGLYTSFRAPLYPAFLSLVYTLSGLDFSRFFWARLAQAIFLGAPLAPLTYLLARQIFSSKNDAQSGADKTARFAAWLVAAYPMLLVYPLGLGTENLFFILLLASFYFLLHSIETPSATHLLLAGSLLALTALTRSVILPFAGLAIFYLFFLHGRRALLTGLAFVVIVSPWVARNSLLHGKLTGIETSMGYNLYLGYHPDGNGSFTFGPSLDLLTIMNDAERDEAGTQQAYEFIREDPGRFVPLLLNRLSFFFGLEKRVLIYFYSNNILGYIPSPWLLLISITLLLPFVFLSVFAVLGFAATESPPRRFLIGLLLWTYILPHVLILAEDRFHLALIPFLAVFAAHAVTLLREHKLRMQVGRGLGFAMVIVLLLLFNWGWELVRDADKIAALLGPGGNTLHFPY